MNSNHKKTRLRSGITITEALASIAVASVGLFAVLAVVPFAARQAQRGLELDVSVAVGKNAFQDFDVRGMGQVDRWRLADGSQPPASFWPGRAFMIDPLYVTSNLADLNVIRNFPATSVAGGPIATGSPRIDRLSLSSRNQPYSFPQADTIFRSLDGLLFTEPADNLQLPNQQFKLRDPGLPSQPNNWLKRSSAGKISWMAMVVPETSDANLANPHMYRLYVVVFRGRKLKYRPNLANNGEAVYEGNMPGSGHNGGLVQLTRIGNGELLQDDYLNAGDWLLLTDQVMGGSNWRWYQIQRVEPNKLSEQKSMDQANSPITTTLVGPDWPKPPGGGGGPGGPGGPGGTFNVHAIALSNVVAVYEKTIRIEYDSIWND